MPIATRSQTGHLPSKKVIQSAEVNPPPKKSVVKIKNVKSLTDTIPDDSPSINYAFNSESGLTTYFSFQYRPLRRKINYDSVPKTPESNNSSPSVPFGLKRRNVQEMPGASMNEVNI